MTINFDRECEGNAAFVYPDGMQTRRTEVARILRKVADDIECNGLTAGTLMDINGNKVGTWKL